MTSHSHLTYYKENFLTPPAILFLTALLIRLAVTWYWQFDGLYGQDPYAYYRQAVAISQNLPQGQLLPTDFFWPNGYPLLMALLMVFLGQSALAGQLAALACGALLSPLAYVLTRDLRQEAQADRQQNNNNFTTRSHWAGVVSGLIIATAGQPILSSVVVMADMPALFWATLSAWLMVRTATLRGQRNTTGEPGRGRAQAWWFLAAGATLGLAIISRWIYALLLPGWILYTLYQIVRRRVAWWPPLPAGVSGLLILVPQIWLSLHQPQGLFHSWLTGWRVTNFFQRQFETLDGLASYRLPVAIFYAQPAGHPAYIFPLLGLAALWGIWRLWQTQQWGPAILLLGWAGPVYLFLAGIPYQNFRFGLTLYMPLVILTSFGISDLLYREAKAQRSRGAEEQRRNLSPAPLPVPARVLPGSRAILKALIILSLIGMLAWAYPMLDNFLTAQNQSKVIARQVEQSLPPEATLLTFGLTLTLQHYTRLNTLEIFYLDPTSLSRLIDTQEPLYLLLDLDSIERQWRGRAPQLNYIWLRENTLLTEVGQFPPYILFKVEKPGGYTATQRKRNDSRQISGVRHPPGPPNFRNQVFRMETACAGPARLNSHQVCQKNSKTWFLTPTYVPPWGIEGALQKRTSLRISALSLRYSVFLFGWRCDQGEFRLGRDRV